MSPRQQDVLALSRLIRGYQVSRMIRAAAEHGLPDQIPPNRRVGVDELARRTGVHQAALFRLCRALAAFGVLTIDADGAVGHTGLSLLLRQDAKPGLHASARLHPGRLDWAAWNALDVALEGKAVPFNHIWGTNRFTVLAEDPGLEQWFDAAMDESTDQWSEVVASATQQADAPRSLAGATIVDIGGGRGVLLRAILAGHPTARGVLYILSRILHDWDDETGLRLLRACRQAMPADAQLWIVERIMADDPAACDPLDCLADMQMMVALAGRERTSLEFEALLDASGLQMIRVLETNAPARVITAAR